MSFTLMNKKSSFLSYSVFACACAPPYSILPFYQNAVAVGTVTSSYALSRRFSLSLLSSLFSPLPLSSTPAKAQPMRIVADTIETCVLLGDGEAVGQEGGREGEREREREREREIIFFCTCYTPYFYQFKILLVSQKYNIQIFACITK